MYAVRKGLKTIEMDNTEKMIAIDNTAGLSRNRILSNSIKNSGASVVIRQSAYSFHIDGSQMNFPFKSAWN